MTTLIVQIAGAPVADANTYLDETTSDTLATKYGLTSWLTYTGDKSVALFLAAQNLENVYGTSFRGYLTEDTQTMSFPRTEFYKSNGMIVPTETIPEEVTLAQLKLAIQVSQGVDLYAPPATDGNLSELTQEVYEGVKQTKKWFSPNGAYFNKKYEIGSILSPLMNSSSDRTVRA